MDVKDKQRIVIEFLLVEGCTGDEMAARLRNVYGAEAYSRATVL
jgi:hypothetical protein